MSATDPPRCLICVPVDIGNGATHRDDCPNYITHLRAERDEAIAERDSLLEAGKQLDGVIRRLSDENQDLRSSRERLRAAIEEHRTQIVSVVQSEYDGHAADEALWEALSEANG